MRVFQHIDTFHELDGIGNDILGIQDKINSLSIENYIVARVNTSKNSNIVSLKKKLFFTKNDVHILHYGGQGYPIMNFLNFYGKKILRFHNITPLEFFAPFLKKEIFSKLEFNFYKSKIELTSLVKECQVIWCDSRFNQLSLENLVGKIKKPIEVVPIVREYPIFFCEKKDKKQLSFVGRQVPNKRLEDLVKILYFLKKIDPDYKFIYIGKKNPLFESYNQFLNTLILNLGLSDSFLFYENLPETKKLEFLDSSIAFVSMSEHEGFCIPLLEAMSRNCLVFAYNQEAVRETLNGSGILLQKKDFLRIASLIHFVLNNDSIQTQLLQVQQNIVKKFNNFNFYESLRRVLGITKRV